MNGLKKGYILEKIINLFYILAFSVLIVFLSVLLLVLLIIFVSKYIYMINFRLVAVFVTELTHIK